MVTINTIKGGSASLSLLKDEGVTHIFGNPGTTELPLMDAIGRQSELYSTDFPVRTTRPADAAIKRPHAVANGHRP